MINLVRKDLLLVKRYWVLMGLAAFVVPLLFSWQAVSVDVFYTFLLITSFEIFMLYQFVAMVEVRYRKAVSLVAAAPYPRKRHVVAKYIFFALVFTYCYVAFTVVAIVLPNVGHLSVLNILWAVCLLAFIYGIYVPVQYKFGYEKIRIIFMVVVIGIPYLLPSALERLYELDIASIVPAPLLYIAPILLTVGIFAASIFASIKMFEKQDII